MIMSPYQEHRHGDVGCMFMDHLNMKIGTLLIIALNSNFCSTCWEGDNEMQKDEGMKKEVQEKGNKEGNK